MAAELTGDAGVGGQSANPSPTPSQLTATSSHCGTACSSCKPRARVLPSRVGGRESACTMANAASPSFESPATPGSCIDNSSGFVAILGRCDALRQRCQRSSGLCPSPVNLVGAHRALGAAKGSARQLFKQDSSVGHVKEVEPASERTSSLDGQQPSGRRVLVRVRTSLVTDSWAQLQSRNKAAHPRPKLESRVAIGTANFGEMAGR